MAVITLANSKGGAGKTTAALLLACEFARQGKRTAILDCDPQHWITNWADLTGPVANLEVISAGSPAALETHIRELRNITDMIIVDLAGARDQICGTALALSDHVLIPVQGCAMDAQGAAQILDLLHQMETKAGLKVSHSVVLTRVSAMVTTRAMLAIKGLLAQRGVHVLSTVIAERNAFRDLFDCGGTLSTMDPAKVSNLDRARDNVMALVDEVSRLLPVRVTRSGMRSFMRLTRAA